ncbi:MAG: hypothetical protein OEZ58_18560 [Gammaproteobacteria bacterium]|nr:hypothetical protein [Gammaproteobacteria bacterium]MDH5730994.1 hypothetical protein [Gammaproteobacteria bacterium]
MNIEAILQNNTDKNGKVDIDQVKRDSCRMKVKPLDCKEEQLCDALIFTIQLIYCRNKDPSNLFDLLTAKQSIENLTHPNLEKHPWVVCAHQIGTHHHKTMNDKIPSPPLLIALDDVEQPRQSVNSQNVGMARSLSGSGNGANIAHYQFLTMTLNINGEVGAIIEFIASKNRAMWAELVALGTPEPVLERVAFDYTNRQMQGDDLFLHRGSKQVFVYFGDQYISVTPVASSKVVAAFEKSLSDVRAEHNARVFTINTKVGGTKPQNAGTLINDSGGFVRHLSMGFPRFNRDRVDRYLRLYAQRKVLMVTKQSVRSIKHLTQLLNRDWHEEQVSTQHQLLQVDHHIDRIFHPSIEALLEVAALSSIDNEKQNDTSKQAHFQSMPSWLSAYFETNRQSGLNIFHFKARFVEELLLELVGVTGYLDQSHERIIRKSLVKLVEESL